MKLITIVYMFSVLTILACSKNKSEQKLENGSRKEENAAHDMKNKINICELIPAGILAQKTGKF